MEGRQAPQLPMLGYNTLRQISEWASGVRGGKPVWFVVTPGLTPDNPVVRTYLVDPRTLLPPEELEEAVIIPTHVGHGVGNRETIQFARLGPTNDGKDSVDVIGEKLRADSAFWTQSAVEKFLVPYYASVAGSRAAERVSDVLNLLGKPQGRDASVDDAPVVYALVHLPQSEYAPAMPEGTPRELPLDLAVAYHHAGTTSMAHIVDFYALFRDYLMPATATGTAGRGAGTA